LRALAGSCEIARSSNELGGLESLGHEKITARPQQPQRQILRGERTGYVNNPLRPQSKPRPFSQKKKVNLIVPAGCYLHCTFYRFNPNSKCRHFKVQPEARVFPVVDVLHRLLAGHIDMFWLFRVLKKKN